MNSLTISGHLGSDAKQTPNDKGGTSFAFTVFVKEYDFKTKENIGIPVYCRHYAATDKATAFIAEKLTKGSLVIAAGKFSTNLGRADKDGNPSALLCMDASQLDFPSTGKPSGNEAPASTQNPYKKEAAKSLDIDDLPF